MTEHLRQQLKYFAGARGPCVARHVFRDLMWRIQANGSPVLYLTFDDGPTPHLTPRLLQSLSRHDALATFFLLGKHVIRDPDAVERIEAAGHGIGLHGFDHLDGWKTDRHTVMDDLERGFDLISSLTSGPVRYFRPPFGRFRKSTLEWARRKGLRVVMWDVMPGDFLSTTTHHLVVSRVCRTVRSGSIVVLHDSWNPNVIRNTDPALTEMLTRLAGDGWRFERL